MTIKYILEKLIKREDLSSEEAYKMMDSIMSGQSGEAEIAAYLVALRIKGETVEEILGSCRAIREHCRRVQFSAPSLVDTCGTGGDAKGTFNISTVSAFAVAGAGVPVAKHGNRAVSGSCGSADLLEALGISINLSPEAAALSLQNFGLAFLFAPALHPAMANAAPARKALQIRTIFNILGPLNNPAGVKRQLIGVFEPSITGKIAEVLLELGSHHAMIVSGEDGTDEISMTGETRISELKGNEITNYQVKPEDFGFKRVKTEDISGGNTEDNVRICLSVLKGEKGAYRDTVLLNAGAALYVAGVTSGIREGIESARKSIDSGAAFNVLDSLMKNKKDELES